MFRWVMRKGIHKFVATCLPPRWSVGFGLAASAAAQVSDQPAADCLRPDPRANRRCRGRRGGADRRGHRWAGSGPLAGRIGTGNGRRGAIVALVLGPIGLAIGGLVVATADGGLGTGNGLAGGFVAMMVGLIGIALGGLALARSRRTA